MDEERLLCFVCWLDCVRVTYRQGDFFLLDLRLTENMKYQVQYYGEIFAMLLYNDLSRSRKMLRFHHCRVSICLESPSIFNHVKF